MRFLKKSFPPFVFSTVSLVAEVGMKEGVTAMGLTGASAVLITGLINRICSNNSFFKRLSLQNEVIVYSEEYLKNAFINALELTLNDLKYLCQIKIIDKDDRKNFIPLFKLAEKKSKKENLNPLFSNKSILLLLKEDISQNERLLCFLFGIDDKDENNKNIIKSISIHFAPRLKVYYFKELSKNQEAWIAYQDLQIEITQQLFKEILENIEKKLVIHKNQRLTKEEREYRKIYKKLRVKSFTKDDIKASLDIFYSDIKLQYDKQNTIIIEIQESLKKIENKIEHTATADIQNKILDHTTILVEREDIKEKKGNIFSFCRREIMKLKEILERIQQSSTGKKITKCTKYIIISAISFLLIVFIGAYITGSSFCKCFIADSLIKYGHFEEHATKLYLQAANKNFPYAQFKLYIKYSREGSYKLKSTKNWETRLKESGYFRFHLREGYSLYNAGFYSHAYDILSADLYKIHKESTGNWEYYISKPFEWLSIKKSEKSINMHLGNCKYYLNEYDSALKYYEKKGVSKNKEVQYNLGNIYQNAEYCDSIGINKEAAIKKSLLWYQKAVKQGHRNAAYMCSKIFYNKNEMKKVEDYLEIAMLDTSIYIDGYFAEVYLNETKYRSSNISKAREIIERIPEDPYACFLNGKYNISLPVTMEKTELYNKAWDGRFEIKKINRDFPFNELFYYLFDRYKKQHEQFLQLIEDGLDFKIDKEKIIRTLLEMQGDDKVSFSRKELAKISYLLFQYAGLDSEIGRDALYDLIIKREFDSIDSLVKDSLKIRYEEPWYTMVDTISKKVVFNGYRRRFIMTGINPEIVLSMIYRTIKEKETSIPLSDLLESYWFLTSGKIKLDIDNHEELLEHYISLIPNHRSSWSQIENIWGIFYELTGDKKYLDALLEVIPKDYVSTPMETHYKDGRIIYNMKVDRTGREIKFEESNFRDLFKN